MKHYKKEDWSRDIASASKTFSVTLLSIPPQNEIYTNSTVAVCVCPSFSWGLQDIYIYIYIYIYISLFSVNMGCVDSFEKETPRRAGFNEYQQSMF